MINEYELAYVTECDIPNDNAHSFVTYFKCLNFKGETSINGPDNEIVDLKWVSLNDIHDYIFNEDILVPLHDYIFNNKKDYYLIENLKF